MKLFLLLIALALCALSMEAQPLEIIWDRSGLEDGSGYGYGILALGDQNDDGFNDWAVWAVGYADPAYVEFFHGDSTPLTTPYMTITGNLYPWGAARAMGDMNGDGYVDWLLKFFGVSANIYWGGPEADTTADLEFTTSGGADDFMPIGDFNGDGYSDLYWYHFSQDFGEIYYGGMNMDTIPDWSRHSPDGDYAQQAYPWDYGNLNGDNADDFVSSTYPLHTTHIFLGGTSPDTIPAYTWESLDHRPRGVVNDLNNDGYDELVYNAQGSAEGHLGDSILSSVPDFIVDFPCTTPTSVYNAGDFNGDGFGDLILLTDECAGEPWGVLSMYLGHPWLNEDPAFTIFGSYPNQIIRTAAGVGDVNGDDIDDLAVGYWNDYPDESLRGRAVIIAGDTDWVVPADDSVPALPHDLAVQVYPNPFNAQATLELQIPLGIDKVSLTTFNLLGQSVRQENVAVTAGLLHYVYDGSSLSSGLYFLNVTAGDFSTTQKLMVLS